jgi:hypothetical protein
MNLRSDARDTARMLPTGQLPRAPQVPPKCLSALRGEFDMSGCKSHISVTSVLIGAGTDLNATKLLG